MARSGALEEALAAHGKPDIPDYLDKAEHERRLVTDRFPIKSWGELDKSDYALGGDRDRRPFCWFMEFGTKHLAAMGGGSATKHIMYREKDGNWWTASTLQDLPPDQAWEALRADFITAFSAAHDKDFARISELPALWHGQSLVTKSLACYFPDLLLPIASAAHLQHFIRLFGSEPVNGAPAWELNRQLTDLVRNDAEFSTWDFTEVMIFLYEHLDPRQKQETIRVSAGDKDGLWTDFLRDGVLRVGWDGTYDLADYTEAGALADHLAEVADDGKNKTKTAEWLLRFRDLVPGTRIVATRGFYDVLAVGTVTTEGYRFDPELPTYRHVLGVDWDESYKQTLHKQLPRGTFQQVSPTLWSKILAGRQTTSGLAPDGSAQPSIDPQVRRVLDNLERKGQVLLHGPPGTGKTRLAFSAALALFGGADHAGFTPDERREAINRLVSGDPDSPSSNVRLVGFHPSYGYEDFVEGFKPVKTTGTGTGLSLERRNGIFLDLCETAQAEPDQLHLLIIDEINRADLPRVLGELVTVLERDKRGVPIRLPISGRRFSIPPNVRVIGTMNTTDRSLSQIDRAIQRRFARVEVPPDPSVLDASVGGLRLDDLLRRLNTALRETFGPDHELGHSFFLENDTPLDDEIRLHAVFYDEVAPLLQDFAFDHPPLLHDVLREGLAAPDGRIRALAPEELPELLAKRFGVDE